MQKQNQLHHADKNEDFALKETAPHLGSRRMAGDRQTTSYDLVEQMQYLYVRVVKARDGPPASQHQFVEVKLGNYKGTTTHVQGNSTPEWNQVFAFSKDRIQASDIEIVLKEKKAGADGLLGVVLLDLHDIPKRVPPDSSLAPQWYQLTDPKGNNVISGGELMLAAWLGTQADEAFPDAWHLDAASLGGDNLSNIRSKVYISPKLWYLRVNIIEALDLQPGNKGIRNPDAFVKAILGNFVLRTKSSQGRSVSPMWNEDLVFVATEPFQEQLSLIVEDKVAPNKEETLGKCLIPLQDVEKRFDSRAVTSRWYNLVKNGAKESGDQQKKGGGGGDQQKKGGGGDQQKGGAGTITSKIHLRICFEGGYHVLDELTHYSSDLRAAAKHLWKPSIGVLELGILNASDLSKTKENCGVNAYCVAKYGSKWVRTRTVIDSTAPKWNEQYTWEVFDPCTVITVGVFDNYHLQGTGAEGAKDSKIGKVRIRLSALETNRVYTHSHPLVVLQPSGVKKMGEIQLAIRFSCSSSLNMLQTYLQPLLPSMHYLHPLSVYQLESLRHQATHLVSTRLGRAEPPLRKEAVEYMLDVGSNMWSSRRSKANFGRIIGFFNGLSVAYRSFNYVCSWKNPVVTVLIHIIFLVLVVMPHLVLPALFIYFVMVGICRYRWRPRHPPHMDTQLSHADVAQLDELDEEFDMFPTSKQGDVLKVRYDRLRSIAGKIQTVLGDLATQGERLQSLLSWRDPRATAMFVTFCLLAAIMFYILGVRIPVILGGFYVLRHPKFRNRLPSAPLNFFRRLPARTDSML